MNAAVGASGSQWLWFVSRGSGLILLVALSIVVALGIATRTGSVPRTWHRFTVAELHRTFSLFAVALLVLHIVTAIVDPYVSIGWWATVIPFVSHYKAAAIGLGTLAVDLGAAVIVTSLLRHRLGFAAWRTVHWLAYLAWPVAFIHSLSASNDLSLAWAYTIEWGSAALVATVFVARILHALRPSPLAGSAQGLSRRGTSSGSEWLVMFGPETVDRTGLTSRPFREAPSQLPRLLEGQSVGETTTLSEHLALYGSLRSWGPDAPSCRALIELVDSSGLCGRGGASFPTALKLAAVARTKGVPIVVGNGTEGEPASSKDKVLMARSPHLVLDGAVVAAQAVGAREAVLVCHPAVRDLVDIAIKTRREMGNDLVRLRTVIAAERFVAGEASAMIHWLEKGEPTPTRNPPRLSERGLNGRPTLVQNVETLAHLALIARFGANWYRGVGTEAEPGSMLVTLIGAVQRPGVYEVAVGTKVSDVLDLAGGADGRPQALLFGGYFGSWTSFDNASERPLSRAGLAPLNAAPGAGLIAVLAAEICGLAETARVARYLASESAGQCGPCVFGLPALAGELESLAAGGQFDRSLLDRWLDQVDGRGACRHPDGAVRMVRSALAVFADELERHSRGRCCSPGGHNILPTPARVR